METTPVTAPEDRAAANSRPAARSLRFSAHPGLWAALIAAIFCAVSFVNLHRYGVGYDERIVMQRGQEAHQMFGAVFSGKAPEYDLRYSTSQLYPNLYAFANYSLSQSLQKRGMDAIAAGHVLNILVSTFGLLVLFALVRRLYNAQAALWAVLFLALFPRFVAHAHFNTKDVPVMVFALLTIYLLCVAVQTQRRLHWALGGVAFGVAIGCKLDAFFVVPAFLGAYLLSSARRKEWHVKRDMLNGCIFFYAAVLTVYATWPLLWIDPFLLFKAVKHFSGNFMYYEILYLGRLYGIDALPWHYMPLHLLAVTPVVVLLCIAVGAVVLWRTGRSGERLFGTSLLLFWIALPLAVRVFPGVLQYDGMRHVFIVVPPLLVVGAIGFQAVLTAVSERRRLAIVPVPIVGLVAAWLVWQNVQIHPHQASYLNEAVRTALPPGKLGSYFDFHGWGTTLHHAVNWLNLNAPPDAVIHVTNMRPLLSQYDLRADLVVVSSGPADFVMFPSWRSDYMQAYTAAPLFSVRCFGADILLIHSYKEPLDDEEETSDAG